MACEEWAKLKWLVSPCALSVKFRCNPTELIDPCIFLLAGVMHTRTHSHTHALLKGAFYTGLSLSYSGKQDSGAFPYTAPQQSHQPLIRLGPVKQLHPQPTSIHMLRLWRSQKTMEGYRNALVSPRKSPQSSANFGNKVNRACSKG